MSQRGVFFLPGEQSWEDISLELFPSYTHENEPNCLKIKPVQKKASTERKHHTFLTYIFWADWIQPIRSQRHYAGLSKCALINSKPVGAIFIEGKQLCQDHTSNECGGNNHTQVTLIPCGAMAHVLHSCSTVAISIYLDAQGHSTFLTVWPSLGTSFLPETAANLFKRIMDQGISWLHLNYCSIKSLKVQHV